MARAALIGGRHQIIWHEIEIVKVKSINMTSSGRKIINQRNNLKMTQSRRETYEAAAIASKTMKMKMTALSNGAWRNQRVKSWRQRRRRRRA
jgi:membrane protease subunit (stomatin/prohibitin family)